MPRKVIDVHGHIVAPVELYAYREFLIGARGHYGRRLKGFSEDGEGLGRGRSGVIDPEDLRHLADQHVMWLDGVGTDIQLVSARPYSLMHSERPKRIVHWWAMAVNDAIGTQVEHVPHRLQGVANLPQAWGDPISATFEELDRCVNELGFVGALVNPDPSEGRDPGSVPGLGDEYWYPLYEKLVDYGLPMLVHSCGCVSERENQSLHFINEESIAIIHMVLSNVFDDFPDLKVIVPHGGGSIPYQIGRYRGTFWQGTGKQGTFDEAVRNLYYDSALYTKDALELLVKVIGADRVCLGTERPGDGSHKKSGGEGLADDVAASLRELDVCSEADLDRILGDNAIDIFPRLRAKIESTVGQA